MGNTPFLLESYFQYGYEISNTIGNWYVNSADPENRYIGKSFAIKMKGSITILKT